MELCALYREERRYRENSFPESLTDQTRKCVKRIPAVQSLQSEAWIMHTVGDSDKSVQLS